MGFLTNSKVKTAASKLKDEQSRPYGLDVVFQGQARAFSNVVPSNLTKGTGEDLSAILYGNWSDVVIGYWSAFDLLVNPYEATAYSKGNVQVRERLRVGLENMFSGSNNAARAMILEGGAEWQQISVSPEDAELLASRRFTTEELARLYQVPPPIVGIWDHSSFTNSETAGRWFAQFTLTPWIRKFEAEFARSVFTAAGRESHFIELDFSGFLRGDPAQRWQGYDVALRNRVLTPNEVRQSEGYNKREGGDDFPDAPNTKETPQ